MVLTFKLRADGLATSQMAAVKKSKKRILTKCQGYYPTHKEELLVLVECCKGFWKTECFLEE
jgi:hypothetical protein